MQKNEIFYILLHFGKKGANIRKPNSNWIIYLENKNKNLLCFFRPKRSHPPERKCLHIPPKKARKAKKQNWTCKLRLLLSDRRPLSSHLCSHPKDRPGSEADRESRGMNEEADGCFRRSIKGTWGWEEGWTPRFWSLYPPPLAFLLLIISILSGKPMLKLNGVVMGWCKE